MNAKAETQGSRLDSVKLTLAIALLLGAVGAFYYFAEASLLLRVLGLLATAGVALAIMAQTAVGRRLLGYLVETRTEVRKVVWPTRQETIQTTLIVFAMVIVMGILLWLLDMFLLWAVRLLTGQAG
ncbi:preprotein translocase subunit SecE [Thiohalobacter sp. IOR34]|uniref:preprotein translocase subunit SecE n=1 Tax=Thiohalobacter sp. IOR34 TaxID=3057176 RepID=UPI0025B1A69A|nr:preprotein translocase subunit SecE [Thiohalobacter sp. IOR34]WJW75061.1 preprotein translocase subunit SecE [Thiohalobacter sp. IOR34]